MVAGEVQKLAVAGYTASYFLMLSSANTGRSPAATSTILWNISQG